MTLPWPRFLKKPGKRSAFMPPLMMGVVGFMPYHVLSYWAWSFAVLLASRIGIALTHAVFWSITAALAVRIAPQGKANQALSLLSMGTVLAMVLGIPLGRMIGNAYGWRLSFLLIGAVAVLTAAVLAKNLPRLPSVNSGSLASVPLLLKRGKLMLLYAFTVLMVSAHFTAYSYIEPFVQQVGGFAPGQVTVLLVLYGVAGFVGSLLFGKWFAWCGKAFFWPAARSWWCRCCCSIRFLGRLLRSTLCACCGAQAFPRSVWRCCRACCALLQMLPMWQPPCIRRCSTWALAVARCLVIMQKPGLV